MTLVASARRVRALMTPMARTSTITLQPPWRRGNAIAPIEMQLPIAPTKIDPLPVRAHAMGAHKPALKMAIAAARWNDLSETQGYFALRAPTHRRPLQRSQATNGDPKRRARSHAAGNQCGDLGVQDGHCVSGDPRFQTKRGRAGVVFRKPCRLEPAIAKIDSWNVRRVRPRMFAARCRSRELARAASLDGVASD